MITQLDTECICRLVIDLFVQMLSLRLELIVLHRTRLLGVIGQTSHIELVVLDRLLHVEFLIALRHIVLRIDRHRVMVAYAHGR